MNRPHLFFGLVLRKCVNKNTSYIKISRTGDQREIRIPRTRVETALLLQLSVDSQKSQN